jgi:hypothetical protein
MMMLSRNTQSRLAVAQSGTPARRMSRKPDRGYAMVLFVIVLLVITVMSTTVTTTAFDAATSSRDAGNRLKARALASSAIDEFYGRVMNHPELIVIDEQTGTASVPNNNGVYDHLAFRPTGDRTKWASLSGSKVEVCDPVSDKAKDCYFVQLRVERDGSTRYRWVVVEVTTRVGCATDGSDCTYSKYQQRIRRMQFFDFLFFHEFSTLDPKRYTDIYGNDPSVNVADFVRECSKRASKRAVANLAPYRCAEVAYLEDPANGVKDRIDGPLYTADDYITVCGNPEFTKRILVHGSGYQQGGTTTAWRPFNTIDPNTVCGTSNGSLIDAALNAPLLEMPEYGPTSSQVRNGLRPTDFRLSPVNSSLPIQIEISGSTVTITNATNSLGCSTTCSMGTNAVIYVDNDAAKEIELKGVTNGQLMVYATGDVEITGNLTYQGVTNLTTLLANSTSVTAIVAQGEIKICQMGDCGPYTPVRSIHAYLVSLGGAPHVPGWSDSANPRWANPTDLTLPAAPKLALYGGIAGKYQGVFGGYEGVSRYVVQGYVKDFAFDDRLARGSVSTPPLLVSPKSSAWLRVDISEVPVDETSL